ncbi:glycine/betaine ABC transporter substrate-binding protein [Paraliobacillus quinghaiensis]|uniref:Glycine/betaine ABC transporter substrate-binding protein n=1 Tax=Paraliobacillus quinghaiensis TaxID=470815 RepID=A0A917TN16_9BACI|nr:glycine betaine ABC transporter substrate-binding protein [Paraliobacillus quinghaiensis]GGM29269.1 glycine/betaine ABC transporter substrate-binding protein [Paraliobacillus quinghaiensis]
MFNSNWKKIGMVAGLSLSLVAAGCGQDDSQESQSVSEQLDYTITGIEAGAGITKATDRALTDYENLAGWEQTNSSTGAMLTELEKAIDNEEPIVVAGWTPHFMFAEWDLKYLEDPEGSFGGEEYLATIAREGLEEDMPEAYTILDRIYWEPADMESVMLAAQETDFAEAAQQWVDDNQETVSEWTEGVEDVDGTAIELVHTPWDSERASGHVARIALEQKGYDVKLTPVDPAIVFQSIAEGDADASLAPWMPATHGPFWDEHEGEFLDLGANLDGAKIGLVVPSYMEVDSIEDFEPAE